MIDCNINCNISSWLECMFLQVSGRKDEEEALIAVICCETWMSRCDFVFKGIQVNLKKVMDNSVRMVKELYRVWIVPDPNKVRNVPEIQRNKCMVAPELATVKINSDGAFQP